MPPRRIFPGWPCLFLDRDGVVNESPGAGYVTSWEGFRFRPGIFQILQRARAAGWRTVLITNQQGVARGVMTESDLATIHARMQEELCRRGASFDAIYAAIEPQTAASRRKPAPRMLQEAARHLGIDLVRSWMVGDDDKDIQAGRAAGTGTIRLAGGKPVGVPATYTVASLAQLDRLLARLLTCSKP